MTEEKLELIAGILGVPVSELVPFELRVSQTSSITLRGLSSTTLPADGARRELASVPQDQRQRRTVLGDRIGERGKEHMTDQELEAAVEASRADWYRRAAELGVTTHNPEAKPDSWVALNPGADWAAAEDLAAELAHFHTDQAAHYADVEVDVA